MLHWVRLLTQPQPQMVFTLELGRGGLFEMRVPVPAGSIAEAEGVVARYKREVLGTGWRSQAAQRRAEEAQRQAATPRPLPTRPVAPAAPAGHATRRLPHLWVGGTPGSQRYGQEAGNAESIAAESDTRRLSPDEVR
jgi:hypothetical protein